MHYFPDVDPATRAVQRDFTVTWLNARELRAEAEREGAALPERSLYALETILTNFAHDAQRNAHHLYREAAQGLACLLRPGTPGPLAARALSVLDAMLREGTRKARLAVAGVLGGLPAAPAGRGVSPCDPAAAPETDAAALCALAGVPAGADARTAPRREGRSLVWKTSSGELLVVKRARADEDGAGLALEAAWMERLAGESFAVRFEVPRPLSVHGCPLLRLRGAPGEDGAPEAGLHPEGLALAFLAPAGYFHYPNELPGGGRPGRAELAEMLPRAAHLFGALAGRGIVHDDPIPLFHNRTAQGRRGDQGVYDWRRMGRLDQWLGSCRHPNFGASGLRDLEHLRALRGGGQSLYKALGNALLGLLLVAGSWFRAGDRALRGQDAEGRPADARHLFDEDFLAGLLGGIFRELCHGFSGRPHTGALPFDAAHLAARMAEEMGVDRYMDELFRVEDQGRLDRAGFEAFLVSRGMEPARARALEQGREDISLPTGPHLGRFNAQTSLPELNEFVACAAGRVVAARHVAATFPGPLAQDLPVRP
ncbi:hypothetical protein dsx2_1761 [Desulfovibrio sp. X2]|uniref:SidJ-related pseudokinase n=1 Tax=Desulfovibrio sp. X2 TaxID=941449 RepID=UPI0003587B85|nr:SidJ-related pseudokinase [Desulfovibrio sp. X2]EPR44400.1 hypothetical protein dsx2_1761 [Desulfovibrio sp. X2]